MNDLIVVVFIVAIAAFAWVAKLASELRVVRERLDALERERAAGGAESAATTDAPAASTTHPLAVSLAEAKRRREAREPEPPTAPAGEPEAVGAVPAKRDQRSRLYDAEQRDQRSRLYEDPQPDKPPREPVSTEAWAVRIFLIIGAIALAFAVVLLVRYSFEHSLLGPWPRLILGGVFGLVLIAGGEVLRRWRDQRAVASALVAAGVAALFAVFVAGVHVEEIISTNVGFLGMAGVTLAAVILSLRHGLLVAILGLLAGHLTPLLVASDTASVPALLAYLFLLLLGLNVLTRFRGERPGWRWLAIPNFLAPAALGRRFAGSARRRVRRPRRRLALRCSCWAPRPSPCSQACD